MRETCQPINKEFDYKYLELISSWQCFLCLERKPVKKKKSYFLMDSNQDRNEVTIEASQWIVHFSFSRFEME